jgi:uncharacterized membrane protein
LLNLVLSFQAAYAAPIIMMSQNRQSEIDRRHAEHDYRINVKAELEIELLHNKIDALREQEILQLLNIIQRLSAHLAPELVAEADSRARGKAQPRSHLTSGEDFCSALAGKAGGLGARNASAAYATAPVMR